MANYSVLKAAVQAVVKTNGNQEITGANMQSTLISIINSLGTGYQFMGVATPSTSPGTPDYNVAYIGGAGTYANFGSSITIPVGSICVFKYNGSWTKEQIKMFDGIDDVPTAGSDNLVKSGGVYEEVNQLGQEVVLGWILAEAFTLTSATRDADGNVTAANVVWPDTKTGRLTITRNTEGNVTQMVAIHDSVTYTLTITRNADGEVSATSIS